MQRARMVVLAALAMSVGWGFRGDYGHETGAILPGALLGLSIAIASGRSDWLRRATLIALFCGLGWAIGGQMSYGLVIGYTVDSSLANVAYGFASLFTIGALWGGIGSAALGVSLTWRRSELATFAWPLVTIGVVWFALDQSGWTERLSASDSPGLAGRWVVYDVDWLAAVSALAVSLVCAVVPRWRRGALVLALMSAGWLAGFVLLVEVAGLRMTPPRSDNWAGCVGLFAALVAWCLATRQRAVLWLIGCGLLAGGFGFSIGQFWQVLNRAEWGPLGTEALRGLNGWKWMEQFFGLLMGFGVALGAVGLLRGPVAPAEDDQSRGAIDVVALLFLLLVLPWTTLGQNIDTWQQREWLVETFFGLAVEWWLLAAAYLVSSIVVVAVIKHQRGTLAMVPESPLGRAQWLFLILLWVCLAGDFARVLPELSHKGVFYVHVSFWLTAGVASLLVLSVGEPRGDSSEGASLPFDDVAWRPGPKHLAFWLAVPLVLFALARLAIAVHDGPLPGSRQRFGGKEPTSRGPVDPPDLGVHNGNPPRRLARFGETNGIAEQPSTELECIA